MPSLKEIKTRIGSVKNTLKITSAMKLVSSAKLHKAQMAIEGMLPYSQRLEAMLRDIKLSEKFNVQGSKEQGILLPSLERGRVESPQKTITLVAISSSTSLCGAFNHNLIRHTQQLINDYQAQGLHVLLIPIGRKVAQAFSTTHNLQVDDSYVQIGEKPLYAQASALSSHLTDLYQRGQVQRVELLYTHYKNIAVQVLTHNQFLPIEEEVQSPKKEEEEKKSVTSACPVSSVIKESSEQTISSGVTSYILEPTPSELILTLYPRVLAVRLFATLLDSSAAEHAARSFAMQQATDNAEMLLQELNLQYNKVRQQSITNELLDIVGGTLR